MQEPRARRLADAMRDSTIQSSLVVVALLAISCATGIRDGTMPAGVPGKIAALICLTIGIIAMVIAIWIGPSEAPERPNRWSAAGLIVALVGVFAFHLFKAPTILLLFAPSAIPTVMVLMGVGTLAAIANLLHLSRAGLLLAIGVLGSGVIAWTATTDAAIDAGVHSDVQLFQQRAAKALLGGDNPYAIDMPNMYGAHSRFYAPGMVQGSEVRTGYPYPPLTLLAAVAGQSIGDVRWALVLAGAISACMLAWIHPGAGATSAAALFLFAMPALFILPLGYTDVLMAGAMIATVLCSIRFPRAVPLLLGVLLGTKQYAIVLLPAMILLAPQPVSIRRTLRWFWPAIVVAGLLMLPPFLVDFGSAWRSMVLFHFHQPFRSDSLGYLPLLGEAAGARVSGIAPWIALLLAAGLIWMRAARTGQGFCIGSALLIAVFFAFGKQAFANYYFFVIACLCAAIATADSSSGHRRHRKTALAGEGNWTTAAAGP
jgi:hypothetical protein